VLAHGNDGHKGLYYVFLALDRSQSRTAQFLGHKRWPPTAIKAYTTFLWHLTAANLERPNPWDTNDGRTTAIKAYTTFLWYLTAANPEPPNPWDRNDGRTTAIKAYTTFLWHLTAANPEPPNPWDRNDGRTTAIKAYTTFLWHLTAANLEPPNPWDRPLQALVFCSPVPTLLYSLFGRRQGPAISCAEQVARGMYTNSLLVVFV